VASKVPTVGIHNLEHPGSKDIPSGTFISLLTERHGHSRKKLAPIHHLLRQMVGSRTGAGMRSILLPVREKLQSVSAATSLIPWE
jgi:hypothetical protein